jgi:phage terminase large subunit-like protein
MYASHSNKLALSHSRLSRDVIESEWYQQRWGDRFKLLQDQNTKSEFANDKTGFRKATSSNSKVCGEGAHVLILDDPNDTNESDVERDNTNTWVDRTWASRVNDRKDYCKIIVQQRTHENDVSGNVLKNNKNNLWTCYIIPMEFDTKRKCKTFPLKSTNGKPWEDPRKVEGELLWPEKIGPKELSEMKAELKSQYYISGQLQQLPAPADGSIFKRQWFQIWKGIAPPDNIQHIIQSWDIAITQNDDSCYSACTTWGLFEDDKGDMNSILLSLWRGMAEYPTLRKIVQHLYYDYKDENFDKPIKPNGNHVPDIVLIEAKHAGVGLIQDLITAGIPAIGFNPDKYGDKIARARIVSHLVENKKIWVPGKPPMFDRPRAWADLFITQCTMFPKGETKDLVDTFTQVLLRLKDGYLSNSLNINRSDYFHDESITEPIY